MAQFKSTFFPDINMKDLVSTLELSVKPLLSTIRNPKVVSMNDVVWAGEKMLEATLNYDGLRPLLIYFPRGSQHRRFYAVQELLGMMGEAAEAGVCTPSVLNIGCPHWLDVGRELVVFFKDTEARSLIDIWPKLCKARKEAVIKELASVMLKLFRHNLNTFCTTRTVFINGKPLAVKDNSKLSVPCFYQGPLSELPPRRHCKTASAFLSSIATRIPAVLRAAEKDPDSLRWPGKAPLTEQETTAINGTWAKMGALIPYFIGGFYYPTTVSNEARRHSVQVLTQNKTGIHHDLDMSRLLVSFEGLKVKIIIGSGWEHSYHGPHWSVSRMPSWLISRYPEPRKLPIKRKEQRKMSQIIYNYMRQHCPEWIICYTFGEPCRIFEGFLKSHWMFRDSIEVGLKMLQTRWEGTTVYPFPIDEIGNVIPMEEYTEWARAYLQKHPDRLLAWKGQHIQGNSVSAKLSNSTEVVQPPAAQPTEETGPPETGPPSRTASKPPSPFSIEEKLADAMSTPNEVIMSPKSDAPGLTSCSSDSQSSPCPSPPPAEKETQDEDVDAKDDGSSKEQVPGWIQRIKDTLLIRHPSDDGAGRRTLFTFGQRRRLSSKK